MNEKDKEIKAIAKVLDECCNKVDEYGNLIGNKCAYCEYWCDTNNICCSYNKKEAEALYNAGYRKIPEGSVVLDRHEHQKYCAYKIIEPQIKGCLDRERELERKLKELEEQRDRQAYISEELIQEKHRWTEQARKETAKEIYLEMIGEFEPYIATEIAKEIAKKYGVEVEE